MVAHILVFGIPNQQSSTYRRMFVVFLLRCITIIVFGYIDSLSYLRLCITSTLFGWITMDHDYVFMYLEFTVSITIGFLLKKKITSLRFYKQYDT